MKEYNWKDGYKVLALSFGIVVLIYVAGLIVNIIFDLFLERLIVFIIFGVVALLSLFGLIYIIHKLIIYRYCSKNEKYIGTIIETKVNFILNTFTLIIEYDEGKKYVSSVPMFLTPKHMVDIFQRNRLKGMKAEFVLTYDEKNAFPELVSGGNL